MHVTSVPKSGKRNMHSTRQLATYQYKKGETRSSCKSRKPLLYAQLLVSSQNLCNCPPASSQHSGECDGNFLVSLLRTEESHLPTYIHLGPSSESRVSVIKRNGLWNYSWTSLQVSSVLWPLAPSRTVRSRCVLHF